MTNSTIERASAVGRPSKMAIGVGLAGLAVWVVGAWSYPATAAGADFQAFFNAVCQGAPTGTLAVRCGETPAGNGNLSGDSQTSLNPGQALSGNDFALSRARSQQEGVDERLERAREDKAALNQGVERGRSAGSATWEEAIGGRLSAFVNVKGERFDRERDERVDQERGYEGTMASLMMGADFRIGEASLIGAIFSIDKTDADFDPDSGGVNFTPFGNEGGSDATGYSVNLYASHGLGANAYVEGSVGAGYSDFTFERTVVFQETNRVVPQTNVIATGDTSGYQLTGSVGAGYDFSFGAFSVGPYVRANIVRSRISGYSETDVNNSGLAMAVEDDTVTSLTSVLGIQGS